MSEAPAPLPTPSARDYKSDVKPVWCPGCGDFTVLSSITTALAELALPPEDVAVISGIGCSSRIPAYLNTYGFHGVHGRATALATGLKLSRPAPVDPTEEIGRAARRLMTDDGFNLGVLYVGNRKPYAVPVGDAEQGASRLGQQFAV